MKNERFFRIHWDHLIVLIGLFFCCFAIGLCTFPSVNVQADEEIPINETNFPDPVFREYIMEHFDGNKDGIVDYSRFVNMLNSDDGTIYKNVEITITNMDVRIIFCLI